MVEVVVQMLMIFVLLVFANGRGLLVRRAKVRLPRSFPTHRRQRNQLLQIFFLASRACRFRRSTKDQVLKTVSALPALVLIDRHERSL